MFRSEVIKENLNPVWKSFSLIVDEIGGVDKPFQIICYDWDADGGHDRIHLIFFFPWFFILLFCYLFASIFSLIHNKVIGSVQTTLRECLFGNLTVPLRNDNKVYVLPLLPVTKKTKKDYNTNYT